MPRPALLSFAAVCSSLIAGSWSVFSHLEELHVSRRPLATLSTIHSSPSPQGPAFLQLAKAASKKTSSLKCCPSLCRGAAAKTITSLPIHLRLLHGFVHRSWVLKHRANYRNNKFVSFWRRLAPVRCASFTFHCDDRRAGETARQVCTVLHYLNFQFQNRTN